MNPNGFVEDVLDLLEPLGAVRARAMFGGWGLWLDDAIFGLIVDERLFFKIDESSRPEFEGAGCEPFVYDSGKGRPVAMSYWTPPPGTEDDRHAVLPWARKGLEAAARAKAKKPSVKKAGVKKPAARQSGAKSAAGTPTGKKSAAKR
ncbi:MAG TPA: competence protein TfoX, partial [Myxococcales bacterium]|nr:competence protein TfoX [Myxococcales bacterium]